MVNDLVQLRRQSRIERGDRTVDRARQIAVESDGTGQRLLDQRLDEVLSTVRFGLLGRRDDLFEDTGAGGCRSLGGGGFGSELGVGNGLALLFVEAELA